MINIKTFENGLTVLTDPMHEIETVSLGVWFHAGARLETEKNNGISHFLEHMAFKGTKTRSAYQIAEEIENVGGFINAYTGREITAYHAKMLKEDLSLGLEILADILQNSVFDKEEMEKERGVILQEIAQSQDQPDDMAFDLFQETVYPDQPMGFSILGPAESVSGISAEMIREYMDGNYLPGRTVISLCGNFKEEKAYKLIEGFFSGAAKKGEIKMKPAKYHGGGKTVVKPVEQAHILLGFKGVPYRDPDYYAYSLLSIILGGGMSSRLFQEVREKRGLVYSVSAFSSSCSDAGVFTVYAGTGEKEIKTLIPVLCDEMKKLTSTITEAEVQRAKAQYKSSLLMGLEDSFTRCERQARQQILMGQPIPVKETLKRIGKVSLEQLHRTAEGLLASPFVCTAYGATKTMPEFDAVKKMLKG